MLKTSEVLKKESLIELFGLRLECKGNQCELVTPDDLDSNYCFEDLEFNGKISAKNGSRNLIYTKNLQSTTLELQRFDILIKVIRTYKGISIIISDLTKNQTKLKLDFFGKIFKFSSFDEDRYNTIDCSSNEQYLYCSKLTTTKFASLEVRENKGKTEYLECGKCYQTEEYNIPSINALFTSPFIKEILSQIIIVSEEYQFLIPGLIDKFKSSIPKASILGVFKFILLKRQYERLLNLQKGFEGCQKSLSNR